LEVLELLGYTPAESARWEYGFLRSRAAGLALREVAVAENIRGRVLAVAFSPNGSLLAAGGSSGVISIFDAATGNPAGTLRGHKLWVRCLAFSPDGNLLASGGEDGYVKIWHVSTGIEIRHLPKQYQAIRDLCFSPNGQTVAVAGLDGDVKLWNVSDGEQISTFPGHSGGAGAVVFSADGKVLATMSLRGDVFLWDVSSGQQINLLGETQFQDEASLALSQNGRMLACGHPGSAAVWDVKTAEKLLSASTALYDVCRVAFPGGGQSLLTARGHSICLWDISAGRVVSRLSGRTGQIYSLALSPDGRRCAVGSRGRIHLFALPAGDAHRIMGEIGTKGTCLGFADQGGTLLVGGAGGHCAWDLQAGERKDRAGQLQPERTLAFSMDGALVASEGLRRELLIRDSRTGELLSKTDPQKKGIAAAVFTHDKRYVIVSRWDKSLRVLDASNGRRVWSCPPLPESAVSLSLSPSGKYLAAAQNRFVAVYDLVGHDTVNRINVPATATLFGGEETLAVAGTDGTISIVNPISGQVRSRMRGHEDYISGLAFTVDGARLASAAADGTVRVWAPEPGIELVALNTGRNHLTAVAFGPKGRHLAATDKNGKVYLWESSRLWSTQEEQWVSTEEFLERMSATQAGRSQDQPRGARQEERKPSPSIRD
jgi:WD40 repeat protein